MFAARGIKSSLEIVCFRWRRKELSVFDERIETGREFQSVGGAARKKREPKNKVSAMNLQDVRRKG